MDAKVTVFEVQNDYSVKQHEVALKFPRVSKSRLYIITNHNTQLHLLNKEGGNKEKSMFQHGVSTKVLTVTNTIGTDWEVCMLLSPSEISRLSPNFNIMGFFKSCLMDINYQDSLSSLCSPNKKHKVDVQELSKAAAQFLNSCEDHIINDYCKSLNGILTEKLQAFCISQKKGDMIIGALMALVAAELATSMEGIGSFDYKAEKEKKQEDQREQIKKMMNVFDVMVDLLTVTHQGKRVQIIFRNPCPDNWALGGKKPVHSEETFVFGLCHKVVSISEAESEVQFLQNLQESYDVVSVFHLPAFVENLLMTSAWRNKVELFLKKQDERKQIVHELSSLALKFICSKTCQHKTFMKEFQREMLNKWLKVEAFFVGAEVVCSFGILVAILAAVTAKSIVERPIPYSEEEVEEKLVDYIASSALSSGVSSSTLLDKSSMSSEVVVTKATDEYDVARLDLDSCPVDLAKVELESGDVDICDDNSKIASTNDPGMTDQGNIDGSLKNNGPVAKLPGISTVDIADKMAGNDDYINKEDPQKPSAKFVDPIASFAPCSNGSSISFLDDSTKVIITKVTDEYDGAKPELDFDLVKVNLERCEVGISDSKSKIDSTNDPGMTDQGNIDGSLKNDAPVAELPGVGTLDIADQEAGNSNDIDKEDPEIPGAKLVDSVASSDGSSSTSCDDGLKVIVTELIDEFVEAKINLDINLVDWVQVQLETGVMGVCDAKSKTGITDYAGMTDQISLDGSLKTGEHLAVFPHGGTLGIAVQEAEKGDDADKEEPEKPAAKLVDPIATSVLSSAVSSSTFLHNSLNSFEVIFTRETDKHGGSKPDLDSSSGDLVKAELECGEGSTCDAKSKISSTHDPGITDQGSIDGSLKTYDLLVDLPGVGPIGVADHEADSCDDGDDDVDENSHRHTEATIHENGPTSPEVEETIYSQDSGDGPSVDNSNDDGTERVAQPPSVEARNNALETQDSPFRNRIFKTGFMGLMCLLLVATLIHVLPESVSSALVAIILGLLVAKRLTSRQP
ncbi:uncharacterized protein LOC143769437 isoform X2 [Ranitomeya variabilis]